MISVIKQWNVLTQVLRTHKDYRFEVKKVLKSAMSAWHAFMLNFGDFLQVDEKIIFSSSCDICQQDCRNPNDFTNCPGAKPDDGDDDEIEDDDSPRSPLRSPSCAEASRIDNGGLIIVLRVHFIGR